LTSNPRRGNLTHWCPALEESLWPAEPYSILQPWRAFAG